jgi:hypothetical protein
MRIEYPLLKPSLTARQFCPVTKGFLSIGRSGGKLLPRWCRRLVDGSGVLGDYEAALPSSHDETSDGHSTAQPQLLSDFLTEFFLRFRCDSVGLRGKQRSSKLLNSAIFVAESRSNPFSKRGLAVKVSRVRGGRGVNVPKAYRSRSAQTSR